MPRSKLKASDDESFMKGSVSSGSGGKALPSGTVVFSSHWDSTQRKQHFWMTISTFSPTAVYLNLR